jgi:NOL1/NOP2/sun family putative RNA methylase
MEILNQRLFQEYEPFIPEVETFYESLQTRLPRYLRTNTLRITPLELTEMLEERGYRARPTSLADYLLQVDGLQYPGHLLEATLGYFISQALTSAIAVMALEPRENELICDLCAAPGGKTTHMAQLMQNRGLIIANDKRERRVRVLEHNIRRLGVLNVVTTLYGGQNFPRRWRFNRVLADVPCSGEGTFRFSSSSSRSTRKRSEGFLPKIQRALITRAFDLLTDGGILLYSTCTYSPHENEGIVQYLLENRPAELLPIDLSASHAPGLGRWRGGTYDQQMRRCWRIYPHQINSVGFFLAKIRRRSSSEETPGLL